ncbi:MAG: proline dehydrogenase family protein [Acidobacteria bacterium]|nr:proline dehydrogenase family protein [Acidobacteriota bacterium]
MFRSLMLSLAESEAIHSFVRGKGMSTGFVRRFVAGEELSEAIEVVKQLNEAGIMASLDYLGESVLDASEARAAAHHYLRILEAIEEGRIQCDISLKLTQLGLDIDPSIAETSMRQILECAQQFGNFVRIDMESSAYTDRTLQMFRRLHNEFDRSVGIVIQSYLYRSMDDVVELLPLKPNIRLCKGAYKEPPEMAFRSRREVDRNFIALLKRVLLDAGYTAIATHDEAVIRYAKQFIQEKGISQSRFEFEMLFGVRRDLQIAAVTEGYRVRVYVPYGRQWYPYFVRRLAERPANLWFVIKNLMKELPGTDRLGG